MDTDGPSAQKVYYSRPVFRAFFVLFWAALAGLFLFGTVQGVNYGINHPENRLPPLWQFLFGGYLMILDLFLVLAAIASIRGGRLVLDSERALIPRGSLGPCGALWPYELRYSQVERYGLGIVLRSFGHVPALFFALKSGSGSVRGKGLVLGLGGYDVPTRIAILEEMRLRIGFDPEPPKNWIGDVQFGSALLIQGRKSDGGVCSICGARLRPKEAGVGLCGHCQRKAAGG